MNNLSINTESDLDTQLNSSHANVRVTLPAVDTGLIHDQFDHPNRSYDLVETLRTIIEDGVADGISADTCCINLSNEAITDSIDNLMMDFAMPAWTIRFDEMTVQVAWYRMSVPADWKTTAPSFGTRRARCTSHVIDSFIDKCR